MPDSLAAFIACRLIALDKCPSVRPIGKGAHRLISKEILSIAVHAVEVAVGREQLCIGFNCDIEAGVHMVRSAFANDDTEGSLVTDPSNMFNHSNRQVCGSFVSGKP
eukprot:scpid111723/ scgid25457/ 